MQAAQAHRRTMQTNVPIGGLRPSLAAAIKKSSTHPCFPAVGSDPSVGHVYFNDSHGHSAPSGGFFNIPGMFGVGAPAPAPAPAAAPPPPHMGAPPAGMYGAGAAPGHGAPYGGDAMTDEDKDREIDRLRRELKKAEEKSNQYRNQVMSLQQQVSSMDGNAGRSGGSSSHTPTMSEADKLRAEIQEERSRGQILQVQLQDRGVSSSSQRQDPGALAALQARVADLEQEIMIARTQAEASGSSMAGSPQGISSSSYAPSPLTGTVPKIRGDPLDPEQYPGASKRAVIVGCDYPGQQGSLRAGVADAQQWARFFAKRCKFPEADIRLLTDDPSHYQQKECPESAVSTRANLLRALRWLTAKSSSGDQLFFIFCGHGIQVLAEEFAGRKLCENAVAPTDVCADGSQARAVSDSDVHQALQAVSSGSQATLIYDCCHAGTPLDRAGLNYLTEYVNRGRVDYEKLKGHPVLPRFLELHQWKVRANPPEAVRESNLRCQSVQWAACSNEQFCVELPIDDRPRGVFTYIFICALLKIGVEATSSQILKEIQTLTNQLKGRWRLQQEVKMSTSRSARDSQLFLKA